MTDSLPTIWSITPHTQAKHAILKRYLDAWFPILSRQAAILNRKFGTVNGRRILYIDGFAGPGIYTGGEPCAGPQKLDHSLR
jgi:three-Cys-motif partner protein